MQITTDVKAFTSVEMCRELAATRQALADLLAWVDHLPVKHPQQAEARDRARKLLGRE